MGLPITISFEDLTDNPSTNMSGDTVALATILTVKNNETFSQNDYLLVGKYGGAQTEVVQITSSLTNGTRIDVTAMVFPHVSDTPVTKLFFNEIRLERSITGIGGAYTLLATLIPTVNQFNTVYVDTTATSFYSYRYNYLNSTTGSEGSYSAELPFSGYSFDSLDSIQRRVLDLYVDKTGEFISPASIADWTNELLGILNRSVTDSESGPFLDYFTYIPGGEEYHDISSYGVEVISFIEYSTDGGMTYSTGSYVGPMDGRGGSRNSSSIWSYILRGDRLFIYDAFPPSYVVRVWFFAQQPILVVQSDRLPSVYRSYTEAFVNYGLMRSHERSRRFQEAAAYYSKNFTKTFDVMVPKIRARLNQGNETMSTPWADSIGSQNGWW